MTRIVSSGEAWSLVESMTYRGGDGTKPAILDAVFTAAVLGEQREAALRLHGWDPEGPTTGGECPTCGDERGPLDYPCPTARALGVTE
jgi:hypothetical protein